MNSSPAAGSGGTSGAVGGNGTAESGNYRAPVVVGAASTSATAGSGATEPATAQEVAVVVLPAQDIPVVPGVMAPTGSSS